MKIREEIPGLGKAVVTNAEDLRKEEDVEEITNTTVRPKGNTHFPLAPLFLCWCVTCSSSLWERLTQQSCPQKSYPCQD